MMEIPNIIVHILLFTSLYFEIFLLITFLEYRPKTKGQKFPIQDRLPSVTIIVPCYNEEKTVARTILSLLRLDYPKNKLKIIAVDDGSIDNTAHILNRFMTNRQVDVLYKENGGKHTALNEGLKCVTTDLVGCLDADSFVDSNALREIVSYFTDKNVMAVTPAIKVHEPSNIIQLIQKAEYELSIFIRRTFAWIDSLFVTPGPFTIFRYEVFKKLGNYKEAYNTEDLEIALRMQSHHYKIENAHSAYVYTVAPRTFRKLFHQRLRWTYGFLRNAFDYRFLFLNRSYGNLGILILPVATISIFGALFFMSVLIISTVNHIALKVVEVQAVGFGLMKTFSFDWFFINTKSVLFLIYILIIITLVLIILGKKLSAEKRIWSFDLIWYLFLYGFIAPIWLSAAVYNVAFSRKTSWIDEKSIR